MLRRARRRQRHDGDGQRQRRGGLTYTFAPRIDRTASRSPLNKGFVGVGSDNARGSWDNFMVQVLPPELTLDRQTSFTGGAGAVRRRHERHLDGHRRALRRDGGRRRRRHRRTDRPRRRQLRHELVGRAHCDARGRPAIGGIVFDAYGTDRLQVRRPRRRRPAGPDRPRRQSGQWVVDASVARALDRRTPTTRCC